MQVKVTKPELAKYVEESVKAGHFPSPEAVVEDALLRAIEERHFALSDADMKAIEEAEAQIARGEYVEFDTFCGRRCERKYGLAQSRGTGFIGLSLPRRLRLISDAFFEYIARQSPETARRVVARILKTMDGLAAFSPHRTIISRQARSSATRSIIADSIVGHFLSCGRPEIVVVHATRAARSAALTRAILNKNRRNWNETCSQHVQLVAVAEREWEDFGAIAGVDCSRRQSGRRGVCRDVDGRWKDLLKRAATLRKTVRETGLDDLQLARGGGITCAFAAAEGWRQAIGSAGGYGGRAGCPFDAA